MKLYLIRHASALNVGQEGIFQDEARRLSVKGVEEAEKIGRFLKSLKIKVDLILHSPLIRAEQTANKISEALSVERKVENKLSTEFGLQSYMEALDEHKFVQNLVMVAHQPTLSKMALTMMGSDPRAGLEVNPGSIIMLRSERLSSTWTGQLSLLISPSEMA
ncbi:MAG: phosphohistidine phosphatase SixA [Chloroherpetonaceae bacterium]|nr:phosphohistidine phosphatase SixA [Chloroherpetonaceae bacterium]